MFVLSADDGALFSVPMAATVVAYGHDPRHVFRRGMGRMYRQASARHPYHVTMGETDKDDILVGHPERERAIGLLNDAFSSGYLDVAAFEERSGAVYSARNRGELRATVDGLPTAAVLFPDEQTTASESFAMTAPMQLDANWETVRRKGVWEVPPRILVTGSMGTADLDFTSAVFLGPALDLEVQVSATNVKLKLGRNQEIRYPDLSRSGWSSIKDKAGSPSQLGGPIITVSGSISGMSGLYVKRA
ncbi:DUF1707 domain-containing protein [Gordonia sp. N1V]|uniref:DUF1707 SHOCT-like domain-containing protein n=1 Tax=unclassified Gordonia (in: high G+C Gram-positive bacteria) TaxID=2657482 RepID=UPI0026BB962B